MKNYAMGNLEILRETISIVEAGGYRKDHRNIKLKLSPAEYGHAIYLDPERVHEISREPDVQSPATGKLCGIDVIDDDSYSAAHSLSLTAKGGENILVLNFANSVNPGGGVRYGASAQEEDLCRKSTLLFSLEGREAEGFYEYHREDGNDMASDAIVLTPDVEVIRGRHNGLLGETMVLSVITCAAPDLRHDSGISAEDDELRDVFCRRINGLLHVAAAYGYRSLVLGAWGCGAFGNDPQVVADMFRKAIVEFDRGGHGVDDCFDDICFAVLDHSIEQQNFKAFARDFDDAREQ